MNESFTTTFLRYLVVLPIVIIIGVPVFLIWGPNNALVNVVCMMLVMGFSEVAGKHIARRRNTQHIDMPVVYPKFDKPPVYTHPNGVAYIKVEELIRSRVFLDAINS